MPTNVFSISAEWEEQPGDGSVCKVCKDPIFYKMYVLVIKAGTDREETNAKLCESCYNTIEE